MNYIHFGNDQYIFKLTFWMKSFNKEIRYVILYVHIYCSCMEEPQVLPISFTIYEYILIQFIQLINKRYFETCHLCRMMEVR